MKKKNNRGLKRVVYRSLEELRATIKIAKVTSIEGAITTFISKVDIQRMNRNGFKEPLAVKKRLLKKHEIMLEYFEKTFVPFIETYHWENNISEKNSNFRNRIWMCWWQGLEHAPDLVRICIESIQRNTKEHEVTILTEKNYKDYVHIPEWAEEKFKAGIISRTHYSDLLRFSLLAEHGGIWLDASMFCVESNLDAYFDLPIWSIKRPDYLHASVASGNFATYSMGCNYENRWIFASVRDFLLYYWKENDMLIDYLLLDYLIVLAQSTNNRIAVAFSAIIPNNPNCDELFKVVNKPFDRTEWERIKKDTYLFKLSWKQEVSQTENGRDTFYAKLLDGTLLFDGYPEKSEIHAKRTDS